MFSGNLDFLNDSLIQQSRFPLNAFSILYVRLGSSLAIFLYFHSKALFLSIFYLCQAHKIFRIATTNIHAGLIFYCYSVQACEELNPTHTVMICDRFVCNLIHHRQC